MTASNKAAEQVRTALREEFAGWPALPDLLAHVDEALAAERDRATREATRATVERIRERFAIFGDSDGAKAFEQATTISFRDIRAILDEEAKGQEKAARSQGSEA